MRTVEELARASEEALALVARQPDVREAEVFASANSAVLTRLNYTSHVPCNGVEEPKSTESYGLGIRAVFDTPEPTRSSSRSPRRRAPGARSPTITIRGSWRSTTPGSLRPAGRSPAARS